MNKLQALFEQLRNLDPNDPGRWPLGVRIGTAVLLFLVAAAGGYYFLVWKNKRPLLLEARATEGQLLESLTTKAKRAAAAAKSARKARKGERRARGGQPGKPARRPRKKG